MRRRPRIGRRHRLHVEVLLVLVAGSGVDHLESAAFERCGEAVWSEVVALLVMDAPRLPVVKRVEAVVDVEIDRRGPRTDHPPDVAQETDRILNRLEHRATADEVRLQVAIALGVRVADPPHRAPADGLDTLALDGRVAQCARTR